MSDEHDKHNTPGSSPVAHRSSLSSRIVVVLGPTAGGKSALAVAVARACGGEVIGADSMQVYRELNAGTAKPTAEQRAAVPHHLVDCVEPTEPWTLADWLGRAEALIAGMHRRGVLPVVVGGTNLYLKALLEGMFDGPPADQAFRAALADTPAPRLHAQLTQVDPAAAERIHPNDHKRIVRALEVHRATGQPISQQQAQWSQPSGPTPHAPAYRYNPILIGLSWPTETINRRINARVKAMFDPETGEGLVEETRRLRDAGRLGPQAAEALGTKQCLAYLSGACSRDEAFEQTKIETRRFAKTQRTWLKRYRGVAWLDAETLGPEALFTAAADRVKRAMPAESK